MKSSAVSPGISRSAEHQTLVDTHFHSRVTQWRDVYEQEGVEGAIYRKRLDIVLRWIDELAIPTGQKVLEIGCGAGRCTVALAQRGYPIHAMDSVEGMVNSTQEHVLLRAYVRNAERAARSHLFTHRRSRPAHPVCCARPRS